MRTRSGILTAAILPTLAVIILWSVFMLDTTYEWKLYRLGILPRTWSGLVGILTGPLIHGDLEHVFNNSVPILLLGWCLMYFYPRVAGRVVLGSWLLSGLWVWATARQDLHIGASGVVYGLASFLFFSGVIRRQRALMAISLLVVFLYGSLIWGLLPLVPRISWESHLWGGLVGAVLAWLYRDVEPAHLPPPIQFPEEQEDASLPEATDDQRGSVQVIYHADPGDQEDPEEDAMRERMRRGGTSLDDTRTDVTLPW